MKIARREHDREHDSVVQELKELKEALRDAVEKLVRLEQRFINHKHHLYDRKTGVPIPN